MSSRSRSPYARHPVLLGLRVSSLGLVVFLALMPSTGLAQWRGPDRSGCYPDTGLLTSWGEGGPPLLWHIEGLGKGHGSISIDGDVCYATGQEDGQDVLYCIQEGEHKWKVPYGPSWDGSFPESRCTPAIVAGRVYVTSGSGVVACLKADAPEIVWKKDAFKEFGGTCGIWGIAENLLVSGPSVFFTPGGEDTTMIALNRENGQLIWKTESLNDHIAYTSPILIHAGEGNIVVNLTAKYLFGVDAKTGELVWQYRYYDLDRPEFHPNAPIINAVTPIFRDGRIFITSGYNHVGAQFQVSPSGDSIALRWKSPTLDCHHGGVLLWDGHIYGANWESNTKGAWCCLDWETGETRWEEVWYTKGSIIEADGLLYCYEEKRGHLGLVRPSAKGFELISSFRIERGTGPHWSHPSIHDGILYVRHGDAAMAFDLRAPKKN